VEELIGEDFTLEGADVLGELLGHGVIGPDFQDIFARVTALGCVEGLTKESSGSGWMEEKTGGLQRYFLVKRKLAKRRDLVGDCGGESARAFLLQEYGEIPEIHLFGSCWGAGISGDALVSATSFLWNHNPFDG